MAATTTVTTGLLVRMQAKPDKEPATTAWFAIRLGASEFAIFDVFPDDAGRQAHLSGAVGKALAAQGPELFAQSPTIATIEEVDVLWSKLPG